MFPDLVSQDSDGYYGVNYTGLIPIIVESLKEQREVIWKQQMQIEKQQEQIQQLLLQNALRSAPGIEEASGMQATIIDNCKLYQNIPNPFTGQTEIKYLVAQGVKHASICIFDMQGKMLQRLDTQTGAGSVYIDGARLPAGMYLYSLVADGQEVDTKRMVLTK